MTIGGRRVSYMDKGDGPALLFLHGWGAPVDTYRLLLDHLSAYRRVIAPDLPGFGGSEEPPVPWTAGDYADFVLAFTAALGISEAALMGHSNGGRIGIQLLTRPACPLCISRAVLLDAAGIKPKRSLSYYGKVYSFKMAKRIFQLPGIRRLFPHAIEKARAKAGSADYNQASPLMRRTMSLAVNEDLTPVLSRIAVPTLLIWGERDTATPLSDGQCMQRHIPDAGLVVLPGGGHFAFAEQWGLCRRVLDSFLK